MWEPYKDEGLIVFGIGGEADTHQQLIQFEQQMGVTFPILYDQDILMQLEFYMLEVVIMSPYPKDWIIGVDGIIRYVNNKFDSEEMISLIEEELDKMHAAEEAGRRIEP